MLVYDLEYDDAGNVVDAILMQANYGIGKGYVKTKISTAIKINDSISFGSANHYLYHNSKLNTSYKDGLVEGSLNLTKITKDDSWKIIPNTSKEYSILRFIQQDENGNAILNYQGANYKDKNHYNEKINLSDKNKDRLRFSRLYIEKTVDKHTDDLVESNEELTYKIVIKNNSDNNYTEDIIVTENISDFVNYKGYKVNKGIKSFSNKDSGKIQWNIGQLNSKEEVIIEYTVTVNENHTGKTIESKGTVANIDSAIIKNKIGYNLTEEQARKIEEAYDKLLKSPLSVENNGKVLINNIYNTALGIDLGFDEFDITNLINNSNIQSDATGTIALNQENCFYDMVLNKYWSALCATEYTTDKGKKVIAYDLKYWDGLGNPDRRADTIYSENFKTGDILIYKNDNDVIYTYEDNQLSMKPITYESGEYAYIYIEGKGFVGLNSGNNYETHDDRHEFNEDYYSTMVGLELYSNDNMVDLKFANYQTLFGKDYYVILRPSLKIGNKSEYKVEHYRQALNGEYPETLKETETFNEYSGTSITPEVRGYEGFTSPERQTVKVAEDGGTVIKYYYTRNSYKVTINKGTGIESVIGEGTYKYEERVTLSAQLKKGYENEQWSSEPTFTMPAKDVILQVNAQEIKIDIISTKYNIEQLHISDISDKTTVEMFKNNINTNATQIQIINMDNQELNSEDFIGTGMEVILKLGNITKTYKLVVRGDVNSDGYANLRDILLINKHRLNKIKLENEYLLAGDVTGDNIVDIKDILKINKYRLQKIQIL